MANVQPHVEQPQQQAQEPLTSKDNRISQEQWVKVRLSQEGINAIASAVVAKSSQPLVWRTDNYKGTGKWEANSRERNPGKDLRPLHLRHQLLPLEGSPGRDQSVRDEPQNIMSPEEEPRSVMSLEGSPRRDYVIFDESQSVMSLEGNPRRDYVLFDEPQSVVTLEGNPRRDYGLFDESQSSVALEGNPRRDDVLLDEPHIRYAEGNPGNGCKLHDSHRSTSLAANPRREYSLFSEPQNIAPLERNPKRDNDSNDNRKPLLSPEGSHNRMGCPGEELKRFKSMEGSHNKYKFSDKHRQHRKRKMPEGIPAVLLNGEKRKLQEATEFKSGGIHGNPEFWLSLHPTILIRNTILEGYHIPFIGNPPTVRKVSNRRSALKHADFVSREISTLLRTGAVEARRTPAKVCSPLSVAEGRKLRLVLDLSELNHSVLKEHFKIDDLSKILPALPEQGFMCTFDLKSGYHHVLIAQEHREFLGFEWNGEFFNFAALPFGLSSAPHLFTKLLKPLIYKWRMEGIGVGIYLDDGIIFADSWEQCKADADSVGRDMESAGFVFAEDKCHWEPCQQQQWLGFMIDLNRFTIYLSEERRDKAKSKVDYLLGKSRPSLRERMQWTGTLASLFLLCSNMEVRHTRSAYAAVGLAQQSERHLDYRWEASQDEICEWKWWSFELLNPLERGIGPLKAAEPPDFVINTDASATGVGAVLTPSRFQLRTFRELPENIINESSTMRELYGILYALQTFRHRLNRNVLVKNDNLAAITICRKGSMKVHLHKIAKQIWELESAANWKISYAWVPREENVDADEASREIDPDDWRISIWTADSVQKEFFKCDWDLFANDRSAKCHKFISKHPCPGSRGIDAFDCIDIWKGNRLWLVPPVALVSRTITMMQKSKAVGILGVPEWKGQYFWPLLCNRQGVFRREVKRVIRYEKGAKILEELVFSSKFQGPFIRFPFLFLWIDFRQ